MDPPPPPLLERLLEDVELAPIGAQCFQGVGGMGREAVVSIARPIERWPSCQHGAVVTLVPLPGASGHCVFHGPSKTWSPPFKHEETEVQGLSGHKGVVLCPGVDSA